MQHMDSAHQVAYISFIAKSLSSMVLCLELGIIHRLQAWHLGTLLAAFAFNGDSSRMPLFKQLERRQLPQEAGSLPRLNTITKNVIAWERELWP